MLENSDTGIGMAHTASVEERELALIDSLLDRYGVIAAPLVDKERIAGGFSALYPVLKRMEEHGTLVRGMFVKGLARHNSRNETPSTRCAATRNGTVNPALRST